MSHISNNFRLSMGSNKSLETSRKEKNEIQKKYKKYIDFSQIPDGVFENLCSYLDTKSIVQLLQTSTKNYRLVFPNRQSSEIERKDQLLDFFENLHTIGWQPTRGVVTAVVNQFPPKVGFISALEDVYSGLLNKFLLDMYKSTPTGDMKELVEHTTKTLTFLDMLFASLNKEEKTLITKTTLPPLTSQEGFLKKLPEDLKELTLVTKKPLSSLKKVSKRFSSLSTFKFIDLSQNLRGFSGFSSVLTGNLRELVIVTNHAAFANFNLQNLNMGLERFRFVYSPANGEEDQDFSAPISALLRGSKETLEEVGIYGIEDTLKSFEFEETLPNLKKLLYAVRNNRDALIALCSAGLRSLEEIATTSTSVFGDPSFKSKEFSNLKKVKIANGEKGVLEVGLNLPSKTRIAIENWENPLMDFSPELITFSKK